MLSIRAVIAILVPLVLAGCGSDQQAASGTVSTVGAAGASEADGAAVAVSSAPPTTASVPTTEPVPSSDNDSASDALMTADEFYAQLTEDDIASVGGPDCATELSLIFAAGEAFTTREGRDADTLDDLTADLDRPITLWAYDADRQTLVPAAGSPCVGFQGEETQQSICDQEFQTLAVATEAYYAMTGTYPTSQQVLVDEQLLREQIAGFTVAGGSVAPDAGSDCENAWAPPTLSVPPAECYPDRRTLEVAIEAYQAEFDSLPDNERVLVDAGMIRAPFDTYDVVYGEIVPGDGSPCT